MKVWLVIQGDRDGDVIVAVWDSKEAADADCAERKTADHERVRSALDDFPYHWEVQEHEVQNTGTEPKA